MYVYTRGCTYERARRHREREKIPLSLTDAEARSLPEERERTHRQRRRDGERSRCEIRRLFPPGFIHPSFSLPSSLSLLVRTTTRSLAYIRTRCAGRNLPPWKTTQRHRQSAFRRAIGPRRHSETQWKAQIRHRLPVHGNEFGKLLANPRAGLLACRHGIRRHGIRSPSAPRRLHLPAITSECWKLDDWS